MNGITEVYFVRHGESECNRQGHAAGWYPTPLSELGREQARKTGELLAELKFDKVYSSDLVRAVETCNLALPGAEPQLSELLREIDVGSLRNQPTAKARQEHPLEYSMITKYRDFSLFGGESHAVAQDRLFRFVETELNNLPQGSKAAVFCHLGTVLYMLNYVLGQQVDRNGLQMNNAAVFKFIRLKSGRWQLAGWNATGKL